MVVCTVLVSVLEFPLLVEACTVLVGPMVLSVETVVVPGSVDTRFSAILTPGVVVSVTGVTVTTSILVVSDVPVLVDVAVSVVIVAVVVSAGDEVVLRREESGGETVEDSGVDDGGVVEESGMVVPISVVWPIPEPAVPWAVADVESWKRATTVGVSFSRLGVVWGRFAVSLGGLVVVSMADIVVDVRGDWLVVTPVSSMEPTSSGAVVENGGVVASRISLPEVSVVKDAN